MEDFNRHIFSNNDSGYYVPKNLLNKNSLTRQNIASDLNALYELLFGAKKIINSKRKEYLLT